MQDQKIKVLYLAGWDRSGSTILSNVVGEVAGFFSAGEINNLWQRGVLENKLCGCGLPFSECEVWQAIMAETFGAGTEYDARQIEHLASSLNSKDLILAHLPGGQRRLAAKVNAYTPILTKLYPAIQRATGCKVIIDASKNPIHGYVLANLPNVELTIVHLVRDARGVAYSLQKKKAYDLDAGRPVMMDQHGPLASTAIWSTWNMLIERMWHKNPKYMMLRYEDFMDAPVATVQSIIALCQEPLRKSPFVGEQEVLLHKNHNVAGNPSRFQTDRVRLEADNAWQNALKPRDRLLIETLFAPFLAHFGYMRPKPAPVQSPAPIFPQEQNG